jgi:hypothetical protein
VYLPANHFAVCSRGRFQPMREIAYSQVGIQHIAVRHQPQLKVTYLDTMPGERRSILNLHKLVDAMQHRFPTVKMNVMQPRLMSADEQTRQLSETSILVSNIGSRSFRLIFLPDGARVLFIGAPEIAATEKYGKLYEHDKELTCWAYIGYVTPIMYRVFNETMYRPAEKRPISARLQVDSHKGTQKRKWQSRMQIWDADIIVEEKRFGDLLEEELSNIEMERRGE